MGIRGDILVVDDDVTLLQLLELTLTEHGYSVATASNGRDALRSIFASPPDLIVLDIVMPGLSGWEVCERIREVSDVPIIILTASQAQEDRVQGLEIGADDYLSKPFDVHELVLRIGAVLRRTMRSERQDEARASRIRYDDGHLFVDIENRVVEYNGLEILLTPNELDLLTCFIRHPGRTLSTEYLLRRVWGLGQRGPAKSYVKTYVYFLRQKIEPDPDNPTYILTERGLGYRFSTHADRVGRRERLKTGD